MAGLYQIKNSDLFQNVFQLFDDLRGSDEIFDVTLACDDYTVQAHKVILSASSTFFREVIRSSKHPIPYIYLKGVGRNHLKSIVDYIYTGEAQIPYEDIKSFIACATELKISGLMTHEVEIEGDKKEVLFQWNKDKTIQSNGNLTISSNKRKHYSKKNNEESQPKATEAEELKILIKEIFDQ